MADLGPTLQKISQLIGARDFARAHAMLAKLAQKHGDNPNVSASMCRLFVTQQRFEEALPFARRALKAAPNDPNMVSNLANVLATLERSDEALPLFERVLQIDPSRRNLRTAYATLLMVKAYKPWQAAEAARVGLERVPGDVEFMTLHALAIRECGRAERAFQLLRACVAAHPSDLKSAVALANTANYVDGVTHAETAALHRRVGTLVPGTAAPPPARALDGRRMRVGILSPDLRGHSVAYFIEPVMREIDRERFEVVCFSSHHHEDDVSERLRALASAWHRVQQVADDDLAAQIRAERIDVLLDLAGLTRGSRFEVLKLKPAPVQITYCGYPNTTGLGEVDYRIVDARTDPSPPEDFDSRCTERLLRLEPCFLCFTALKGAPEVAEPPCASGGSVTFGSFNALFKLSDRTVRLWARVVNAVPGSRLVLKNLTMQEPQVQDDVRGRFAEAGLDPARIDILGWVPKGGEPLRAYDRVDIALDPSPYNGTTTTCEALMMGVPVVALEGNTHAGRVGLSLLSTVGRPELVARDEDEYVRIATRLAADRDRLRALRHDLRADLFRSPLHDATGFTKKFEAALMQAWRATTGL